MTEAYVAQDKSIQEGWKAVAKRLPGVRTVLGLGSAAYRASKGDWTGAALSAGSAIPGPIGWGFVGADIARDLAGGGNKKPDKKPETSKPETSKPETVQAVTPADTKPATPADTKPSSPVGAGAATAAGAVAAKASRRMVGGGTRSAAMSKAASQAGTQKALTAIGRKYITK